MMKIFEFTPLTRHGAFDILFPVFRKENLFDGDIAQLVERLNGIEKVRGPTPLISTI